MHIGRVADEFECLLILNRIPDDDDVVVSTAGQSRSVRAEIQREDSARVPLEFGQLVPRAKVPDADHAGISAGCESVTGATQRDGMDGFIVMMKPPKFAAAAAFLDDDLALLGSLRDHRAIPARRDVLAAEVPY